MTYAVDFTKAATVETAGDVDVSEAGIANLLAGKNDRAENMQLAAIIQSRSAIREAYTEEDRTFAVGVFYALFSGLYHKTHSDEVRLELLDHVSRDLKNHVPGVVEALDAVLPSQPRKQVATPKQPAP